MSADLIADLGLEVHKRRLCRIDFCCRKSYRNKKKTIAKLDRLKEFVRMYTEVMLCDGQDGMLCTRNSQEELTTSVEHFLQYSHHTCMLSHTPANVLVNHTNMREAVAVRTISAQFTASPHHVVQCD